MKTVILNIVYLACVITLISWPLGILFAIGYTIFSFGLTGLIYFTCMVAFTIPAFLIFKAMNRM